MGNSLKFEFDFDEVFEGIKQGVIRELTEMEFDAARSEVIRQTKNEVKKDIELTWSDKSQLKDEIKAEIKERVFDELIKDTRERYSSQFNDYIAKELTKNDSRLKELRRDIIASVSGQLYDDLYRSIRRDIKAQMDQILTMMSGNGFRIQGSNRVISKEEYDELLDRDRKLTALENGGVDNWEWYDESLAQFYVNDED